MGKWPGNSTPKEIKDLDIAALGLAVDSRPVDRASRDLDRLSAAAAKAERTATGGLGRIGREGGQSMDRMERATARARGSVDRYSTSAKAAAAANDNVRRSVGLLRSAFIALGGALAARAIIQAADDFRLLENRLTLLTGSTEAAKREMALLFDVAQRTRSDIDATANTFVRLAMSSESTGLSFDQTRKLVEGLNAGFINAGVRGGEAASAMIQLGQAFASGRLQGDELRSVLENLGPIGRDIALELGFRGKNAIGDFRQAASEASITIEQIAAAMLNALLPQIDRLNDSVPTVGQAFTQLRNELKLATAEAFNGEGASAGLVDTLDDLRDVVTGDAFQRGLTFLASTFAAITAEVSRGVENLGKFVDALNRLDVEGALEALYRNSAPGLAARPFFDLLLGTRPPQGQTSVTVPFPQPNGGRVPIPGASGPTEDQIKAAAKAQKEFDKARKAALEDIVKLEADAAAAALEGLEALEHARDVAVEEQMGRFREGLLNLDEFARARLAIEEAFQKEKAAIEQDAADKARREIEREMERATEKRQREAERLAEQQAELLQEPFKNALEGIQDSFTDAFENIFSGGVDTFTDLADTAKRVFVRLAAELATLQIFSGGGFAGALGLGGAGTASAGLGTGGSGSFNFGSLLSGSGLGGGLPSWLGGSSNVLPGPALPGAGPAGGGYFNGSFFDLSGFDLGQVLGGAGIGFGAGSLVNSLIGPLLGGGNALGGSIGSGIGALGGAALGSIIPGVGTLLGGLVGGGLGGLVGGLFGGDGKTVGPNAKAGLRVVNGQLVGGRGKADNGGNIAATEQFADAVAEQVNAVLEALDASFPGQSPFSVGSFGGSFRVGKSYNGGRLDRSLGSDPQAAVEAATLFAFEKFSLEGLDPALAQAVQRAGKISKDLEDFAANIGVAQAILDDSLFGDDTLTQAEQALEDLAAAFDDAAKRAERLGLSVEKVEELRAKALLDLTEGFDEGIRLQILGLTDPIAAALEQQKIVAEQRLKEAEVLGADLVEVERLNALERQRVVEQAGGDLKRFWEEITFGSLSGVSPGASVEAQRAAFEAAAAQGNVGEITRLGRGLLDSARGAYASGPLYQDILGRVQQVVGGHVAGNDNMGAVANTLNEGFGQSITLYHQMLEELSAMRQELTALRQDNARLSSHLEALRA